MNEATGGDLVHLRGMNEDQVLGKQNPEFASYIENMEYHRDGVWAPVPGVLSPTPNAPSVAGATNIWEATIFRPAPGVARLVLEGGTLTDAASTLSWWHPGSGSEVVIAQRRRSTGYWRVQPWLHYGRWLFHFNGLEQPIRWDGSRVVPVGFITPPSPPRATDSTNDTIGFVDRAGALIAATTYNFKHSQRGVGEFIANGGGEAPWVKAYAITVINDLGQESPMSGIAWARGHSGDAAGTNYGRRMVRLKVARQADHIRAVRVWASVNLEGVAHQGAPAMYLHSEHMYAGEFDLFDHTPDLELGIAYLPDDFGLLPLEAHSPVLFGGHLFLAMRGRVVYSRAGLIEQFPSQNYLDLPRSEEVTAMHAVPSGILVFTSRGTFMVKGNTLDGFRLETVSDRYGTDAPAAIVSVPGQGVFFLSGEAGPQIVKGTLTDAEPTSVVPVTGLGTTWEREYAGANLVSAAVMYRPEVDEVWWQLPERGDWLNTRGYALHLGAGGWSVRTDWEWHVAVEGKFLCGKSAIGAGGKVWALRGSNVTTENELIRGVYETGVMRAREARQLLTVELTTLAMGNVDVTMQVKLDRGVDWRNVSGARPMLHPQDDLPVRGGEREPPTRTVREVWNPAGYTGAQGLWSTTRVWFDYEPTTLPISVAQGRAREHQLRFTTRYGRLGLVSLFFNRRDGVGPRPPERT
jgi:hypothetical protein